MRKRSILLMLVVGAVFALFVAPSVALANTWTDITDAQWVQMYGVTAAQVDTVADGYGDGTFGPGNQVTRGQFTKMSVNGLDVAQKTPASPTFSDVPKNNIFYAYIEGAAFAGLVNGTGGGKFSPVSAISRQNVAAILGRWLSQAELDSRGYLAGTAGAHHASIEAWFAAEGASQLAGFTDGSSIGSNMRTWVAYLAARGIAKGSDGRFNPAANITRAQAAVLILRTLDVGKGFGPAPTVTDIEPSTGPAAGGTSVVITGTNFVAGATVKFGANNATGVTINSATQITVVSPAGTAGSTVQVSVTTPAGTSANTAADNFTYGGAPTVGSLSRSAGAAAGGETVTITGTNFTADATVKFGTTAAVISGDVAPTSITVKAPAGTEGTTVDVLVTTAVGTSANTSADNYAYGKPVITSISPVSGPAAGGTSVTINGTGFTDDVTVKFGTKTVPSADVTVNSPTKITAKSPSGTAGQMVQVSVTNDENTSADTVNDNFTYAGTGPSISSLTPSAGNAGGGNEVVIKGVNFPTDVEDDLAVYFGTKLVDPDDIELDSATRMTVTAPAPLAGTTVVDVSIVTDKGTSSNTSADDYSYGEPVLTSISPNAGLPAGGYNVIIIGTGFTADAKVFWDDHALASAKFTVNSPTQITVIAPAGDDGDLIYVRVENSEGASNEAEFEYDKDLPYVTSISPTAGDADGGDTVSITGTNFPASDENDVTVFFGTEEAEVVKTTATKIDVKAPAPVEAGSTITEVVDVTVETDEGVSPNTPADDYSYGRARVDEIEPNTGAPSGGTVVTVTGTGFVKGVSVYFGSTLVTAANVTLVSPTELRVIAPAGTDGDDVRVKVKNAEGTSADADSDDDIFTYDADYNTPVVESVSPDSGVAAGGTVVTISGINFAPGATVSFGSTPSADVTYVSPTELKAVSPANTAVTGTDRKVHVKVTVGGSASDTSADDYFTYLANGDPSIDTITPAYGPIKGGNTVIIMGDGFSSKPTVKFGTKTVTAANVTVVSTARLDVIVPAVTTASTVNVTVTNSEGTGTKLDSYTYFTINAQYSDDNGETWTEFTVPPADHFASGQKLDFRLQVLDGDDNPLTSKDLTSFHPWLNWTSTTGSAPSSMTTGASDGCLYWNDVDFSGKTYAMKLGLDMNNNHAFTSVEPYESVTMMWDS